MSSIISGIEYDYLKDGNNKYKFSESEIKLFKEMPNNGKGKFFKIEYGGYIKTTSFVGIIVLGNKTIDIIPKFLGEDKSEIINNLLYMLDYTKKIKINNSTISSLKKDNLFQVFVYLFASNLLELLKKDLIKYYSVEEDNLHYIKGKIKFNVNIKKNLIDRSKVYCEYDEFIENILINQILKSTTRKLLKLVSNNVNYKLLKACDNILLDVECKTLTTSDFNKIKYNRLNKIYEPAVNLAKLLYFGNSATLKADLNNNKIYSLLFDMNKLFEEFITKFITKEFPEYKIKAQSQLHLFENPRSFLLKPDILLINKNNSKIIIDTKYKLLQKEENNNHNNVYSGDIYQMIAYSTRFFESEKSDFKKLILLYPENKEKIIDKRYIQNNLIIRIETVNLHQDLMKKANILKQELKEIIESSINQDTFK